MYINAVGAVVIERNVKNLFGHLGCHRIVQIYKQLSAHLLIEYRKSRSNQFGTEKTFAHFVSY